MATQIGPFRLGPMGEYSSGTEYSLLDWVTDGNDNYVYINASASTGTALSNTDYWYKFIDLASIRSAEEDRETAEGLRVSAESDRDTAEGLRDTAEGLRVSSEEARDTAEGLRVSAEEARDTAEGLRVSAEEDRETNTSQAISDCEDATDLATAAAAAIASGLASPAGTYADLAALNSADPDHGKIYITLDDGNWCYYFDGTPEVASLEVSAACSLSGDCTITLNGSGTNVALDSGVHTTAALVAAAIRDASFDGWTTGGADEIVTFTANAVGTKTDAEYAVGSTGATAVMTTTVQGVDAAFVAGGVYQAATADAPITDAGGYYTDDNVEDALQEAGAQLADVASSFAAVTGGGVVSGGLVLAQTIANQTVNVSACEYLTDEGKYFSIEADAAFAMPAADGSNPRYDLVYGSGTGVLSYYSGTAAASPTIPSTPAHGVLLAVCYRATSDNTIASNEISYDYTPVISTTELSEHLYEYSVCSPTITVSTYYGISAGVAVQNSNVSYASAVYAASPGDVFLVSGDVYYNTVYQIIFADASLNVLAFHNRGINTGAQTFTDYQCVAPTGTTQILLSSYGSFGEIPLKKRTLYNMQVWRSPLYGGKINVIGDSITAGQYYTGSGQDFTTYNITYWMKYYHGLSLCRNYGSSGTTISTTNPTNPFVTRYTAMDDDADIVIVFGGTNDYGLDCPLGTNGSADSSEFYGAVRNLANGLLTKYPDATIIFLTPIHRGTETANGVGATLDDYRQAIITVCEDLGIDVIDTYAKSGLSTTGSTAADDYSVDAYIHPSIHGYEKLGNAISRLISGFAS